MEKYRQILFPAFILLSLMILTGCGGSAEEASQEIVSVSTSTSGPEADVDATESEDQVDFEEVIPDVLVYWDDFSDPNSGWDRASDEAGTTDYTEGGYHIQINQPNMLLWANPGLVYEDSIVEVDAALVSGSEDNNFGLICRYQNAENFYAFVIGSDGDFAIRKRYQGSVLEIISGEDFGYSSEILSGDNTNHLVAECIGENLSLYVNDTLLVQVEDADLKRGDVGVIVGSFSNVPIEVLFSEFEVFSTE